MKFLLQVQQQHTTILLLAALLVSLTAAKKGEGKKKTSSSGYGYGYRPSLPHGGYYYGYAASDDGRAIRRGDDDGGVSILPLTMDDAFRFDDDTGGGGGGYFPGTPHDDDGRALDDDDDDDRFAVVDDDGAIVPVESRSDDGAVAPPATDDRSFIAPLQDDTFHDDDDDRTFFPGFVVDDDDAGAFATTTSVGQHDDGVLPVPIGVPPGIFGGERLPALSSSSSCSAVPACAHLDGECCPAVGGLFLDCCHEDAGASRSSSSTQASCSAHPGCVGLEGDCCPSSSSLLGGTGQDLYCCYQDTRTGSHYRPDFTLYGHPYLDNHAVYLTSTGQHTEFQQTPGGGNVFGSSSSSSDHSAPWSIEYVRDVHSQYDLVYFRTDAILDPMQYVTGERKFYITIESGAAAFIPPSCTQILLQLDHLPTAQADNYPIGRHSRYLATYTPPDGEKNSGGRLEFDFWDRPDPHVTQVNAMALLFDPGSSRTTTQNWRWSQLDSAVVCDPRNDGNFCAPSPVKRCPAVHVGAQVCSCDNPSCILTDCAVGYTESYLALEDRATVASSGKRSRTSSTMVLLSLGLFWGWSLLYGGAV